MDGKMPAEKKPSGFFGKLFGGSKAPPAAPATEKGKEKVQGLKGLKKADVNVVCALCFLRLFAEL
jgi:hypothetical protein